MRGCRRLILRPERYGARILRPIRMTSPPNSKEQTPCSTKRLYRPDSGKDGPCRSGVSTETFINRRLPIDEPYTSIANGMALPVSASASDAHTKIASLEESVHTEYRKSGAFCTPVFNGG